MKSCQNTNTFQIDNYVFKRIIGRNAISKKVFDIAFSINERYKDKEPVFIITLKGAIFFATRLLKLITIPHTIDTITAKSYGQEMKSQGNVELSSTDNSFYQKDIIIIEDIVDTGTTIIKLKEVLNLQKPSSIAIATLINKPHSHKTPLHIDYCCFELESEGFLIGFGLDYKEYGRNLNGLYSLIEEEQN